MSKELTIYTNRTFINPELNEMAKKANNIMAGAMYTVDRAKVESAKIFAEIESKELYKDDGFASTLDFLVQVFDASESTAYQYLSVGRELNAGRLPEKDANGNPFAYSMLTRMVSVAKTKGLKEAIDNGEINAEMTQKEVDEATKQFRKPRKQSERKEKEYQIFDTSDEDEPAAVTTISNFKNDNGEPFAEFSKDGAKYMLYVDDKGIPTLYRYNQKSVEAEAVSE